MGTTVLVTGAKSLENGEVALRVLLVRRGLARLFKKKREVRTYTGQGPDWFDENNHRAPTMVAAILWSVQEQVVEYESKFEGEEGRFRAPLKIRVSGRANTGAGAG